MADGHITVARFDRNIVEPRYAYYWLSSQPFQDYIFAALAVGATNQIELNGERLATAPLPLPPFEEQRRIANLLDVELARIDAMSSRRERQLALLRERNREHVRDLLRGKNSYGDDGSDILPWFGELRVGWGSLPLRRISRVIMGTTFPHEYQGSKVGDYPFIKVSDFPLADRFGHLGRAENWVSDSVARRLGARIVPAGSVLYARVGAALLLNRRVLTTRQCVIDDNVRAVSIRTGEPRYWLNLLSFLDLSQLMNPGPVPSIGESQVSSVRVPRLPISEQVLIADLVEKVRDHQHRIEGRMRRQLDVLAERRKALLTAAVTGQIDTSTASGRGIEDWKP